MAKAKCECGQEFEFVAYCGANVCPNCNNHKGLERCFCGWSKTSPGRGREELEEAGETIDEEQALRDEEMASNAPQLCDDCGSEVDTIIGCPDGAEICKDCFDAGGH